MAAAARGASSRSRSVAVGEEVARQQRHRHAGGDDRVVVVRLVLRAGAAPRPRLPGVDEREASRAVAEVEQPAAELAPARARASASRRCSTARTRAGPRRGSGRRRRRAAAAAATTTRWRRANRAARAAGRRADDVGVHPQDVELHREHPAEHLRHREHQPRPAARAVRPRAVVGAVRPARVDRWRAAHHVAGDLGAQRRQRRRVRRNEHEAARPLAAGARTSCARSGRSEPVVCVMISCRPTPPRAPWRPRGDGLEWDGRRRYHLGRFARHAFGWRRRTPRWRTERPTARARPCLEIAFLAGPELGNPPQVEV